MFKSNTLRAVLSGVLLSTVLVGCGETRPAPQASSAAPEVEVAEVVSMRLSEWDEFSGRLRAPESVVLMPRVSGYIARVLFTEGEYVNKGDVLVEIDREPFEVEVERLEAQYASAQSHLDLSDSLYQRGQSLVSKNAISQEALDNRRAAFKEAKANAGAIAAQLKQAQLSLSYTRLTAPVSGRVSRADITQGNFVTAGQSELTRIVSTDKMYAYFSVDERTYLDYVRNGLLSLQGDHPQPVAMRLSGDNSYRYEGAIDFVDNQVNSDSGSITLRATFANTDGTLMPGLYAQVRLAGSEIHEGILIDERAVGTDLNNKFVLVIDDDDKVVYQKIQLGEALGKLRIVESGLNEGDVLVVKGLQRVRPGMQVHPERVSMADEQDVAAIQSTQNKLSRQRQALAAFFPQSH